MPAVTAPSPERSSHGKAVCYIRPPTRLPKRLSFRTGRSPVRNLLSLANGQRESYFRPSQPLEFSTALMFIRHIFLTALVLSFYKVSL
jgi:hypothetical protein